MDVRAPLAVLVLVGAGSPAGAGPLGCESARSQYRFSAADVIGGVHDYERCLDRIEHEETCSAELRTVSRLQTRLEESAARVVQSCGPSRR